MGITIIMAMGITTITITIAEPCVMRRRRRALGALPLPIWGEGWGEGVPGKTERPKPLTPSLSQPKSDLSDFGQLKVPNSGKPEFGGEREPTESAAPGAMQ
jgi:hypothetical protein